MFIDGNDPMTDISDETRYRSQLIAEIIARRDDDSQRLVIEKFATSLKFEPIEDLMISTSAWEHVVGLEVMPIKVFAHQKMLQTHPRTSTYYRGIALLPRKRVRQETKVDVKSWETGIKSIIPYDSAIQVARYYNLAISSIIEGKVDWALENGYRNIVATMGITLDGSYRNTIGDMAEDLVKDRIVTWLMKRDIIPLDVPETGVYNLPRNTVMQYGSEPDIKFTRDNQLIATIEIKGGRDPAGALERLGAMSKSFVETPPSCQNFLVAGVITSEMQTRLNALGNVKVYVLDDIANDGEQWEDFTNEVFHHAIRVI